MRQHWLVKTEPTEYSWTDLAREKTTRWTGVAHPLAQRHLRAMQTGDWVLVYHTGTEKQVVGLAEVTEEGAEPQLRARESLPRPVPLAEIKTRRELADWALVRMSRLSVMPVTTAQWAWVVQQGGWGR